MKNKALLALLGLVALLLTFPASASAAELCPVATVTSAASAPVPAFFEFALFGPEAQPSSTWCTKEQCSAARQACRESCLPCGFQFGACNAPSCTGSCNCVC